MIRLRRQCRSDFGRLRWPLATSCFIGQPLALGTFDREVGALNVIKSEFDSMGIAEIKLAQVPLQMGL